MTSFVGTASALANPGTSDHVAVAFEIQVISPIQETPPVQPYRNWDKAPWNHIHGAIKRYMNEWAPNHFCSVHEAQVNYNELINAIIDRYVPMSTPSFVSKSAPWLNFHCEKAFKYKQKAFINASTDPVRYQKAVQWNSTV